MVRNADSIENAIGPKWPGGQYAYGFGGTDEPQRSPSAQGVSCGRRGSGNTDTPIRQYVWGAYIDECIQVNLMAVVSPQDLPLGAYYLLQDLLYRAVALTNSGGYIVEAYDTDAYGNTLIFIEPGSDGRWFTDDDVQSDYGANEIIYCGYRFDPDTQRYYVRNRTYNPVLGRWLQRDPIGYAGGVNLYEYVGGRAAVAVDPQGTSVLGILCRAGCWTLGGAACAAVTCACTAGDVVSLGGFVIPCTALNIGACAAAGGGASACSDLCPK